MHPEVSVYTNPWAYALAKRRRSNGITQQVEHAHGNRAAHRSGALGLSSAEVTILMQLNLNTRAIITLSPGGDAKTH
jgi:hypothetical protein